MVVLLAPYSESSASDSGAGIVQLHKVSILKKKIAIVEVVCMYVYAVHHEVIKVLGVEVVVVIKFN